MMALVFQRVALGRSSRLATEFARLVRISQEAAQWRTEGCVYNQKVNSQSSDSSISILQQKCTALEKPPDGTTRGFCEIRDFSFEIMPEATIKISFRGAPKF
jgi:hypothetical protein